MNYKKSKDENNKIFCFKVRLDDGTICYTIARNIGIATAKARRTFIENVVAVDFVGEAFK